MAWFLGNGELPVSLVFSNSLDNTSKKCWEESFPGRGGEQKQLTLDSSQFLAPALNIFPGFTGSAPPLPAPAALYDQAFSHLKHISLYSLLKGLLSWFPKRIP